jgi:serine/threonine protein kinase
MTLNKKLEFDLPCWNTFTTECKDLLVQLLQKDATQRISLEDALNHDWFKGIEISQS